MTRLATATAAVGIMLIGGFGCGGGGAPEMGSPLPVRDGTYFRYADEARRSSNLPRTTTIRFEDAGEGTFRYIETFRVESRDRPELSDENTHPITIVREDGIILRFADEDLKPSALGKEQVMNRRAKIWLPPEKRATGSDVRLDGFPGTDPVGERRSWQRWKVAVVALHGYEYYFHEDTGFLVGWRNEGGDTWVLEQTNAAGLN
jgi:hypothetical protein